MFVYHVLGSLADCTVKSGINRFGPSRIIHKPVPHGVFCRSWRSPNRPDCVAAPRIMLFLRGFPNLKTAARPKPPITLLFGSKGPGGHTASKDADGQSILLRMRAADRLVQRVRVFDFPFLILFSIGQQLLPGSRDRFWERLIVSQWIDELAGCQSRLGTMVCLTGPGLFSLARPENRSVRSPGSLATDLSNDGF